MHMVPYAPDNHVEQQQRAAVDLTVYVNSHVAVLDDSEDNHYHIAKVVGLTEAETTLHYLGTTSKALRSAKWSLMYHKLGNEVGYLKHSRAITDAHEPLLGTIPTRPMDDSLIILTNVGLTDRMRLNKDTISILKEFTQEHHVLHRTWP